MSLEDHSLAHADHVDHVEVLGGYNPFVPLLIALIVLNIWVFYQTYMPESTALAIKQELNKAQPTLETAVKLRNRFVALARDLSVTSEKDPAAAQIARDFGVPVGKQDTSTPADPGH